MTLAYWKKQYRIGGLLVSGVRAKEGLHSRGIRNNIVPEIEVSSEIVLTYADNPDYGDPFWVGHPALTHDMMKLIVFIGRQAIMAGSTDAEVEDLLHDLCYVREPDFHIRSYEEWREEAKTWLGK